MASQLKVDTLTGVTTAGSIDVTGEGNSTTTNLQQGLAKAFIIFTQAATYVDHNSFNVSSLGDDGTGLTTINWSSAFSTAYYSSTIGIGEFGVTYRNIPALGITSNSSRTTNLLKFHSQTTGQGTADTPYNSVTIHGDLA